MKIYFLFIQELLPKEMSVYEFFSNLLEAPDKRTIDQSVRNLISLGIFRVDGHTECLTPIGRLVNRIPADPILAKSLLYSYLLRLVCYLSLIYVVFH